ncbi:MAG TPA: FAD-dependent oxidoreductase [Nanoarchaeota archaeon]|nr:FAD-dependent oxidoreductase [Nanoarchaeota archaeon]
MKKIIILGGGIAGLSAAERLAGNFEVVVLEKEEDLGGLAGSFDINGRRIPKYYHHIFSHDNITKQYLKKAGLLDNIKWKHISMVICKDGKFYQFTNPLKLLQFNLLSVYGRIRYALFGLYVFVAMDPSKLPPGMGAREWLIKYAGKEVTEKIFNELYAINKFNTPLESISAKKLAHRLKEKEAMGVFGYPPEGLDRMIDYMRKEIERKGGNIIAGIDIKKIDLEKGIVTTSKGNIEGDVIINTMPPPVFLSLSEGVPADYRQQLSRIKYCPVVGMVIGTEKLLGKFYWYNLFRERVHIIMQHSWLYDGYGEKVSWVSRYGGSEEDMALTDKDIETAYGDVLRKYFAGTRIVWSRVFRNRYASPIYDTEYDRNKPDYKTPLRNLYMAGIAVTYPEIRNMNTAFKSGIKVAEIIAEEQA